MYIHIYIYICIHIHTFTYMQMLRHLSIFSRKVNGISSASSSRRFKSIEFGFGSLSRISFSESTGLPPNRIVELNWNVELNSKFELNCIVHVYDALIDLFIYV